MNMDNYTDIEAFLNPIQEEEVKIAISDRFKNKDGKTVKWVLKAVPTPVASGIRKKYTKIDNKGRVTIDNERLNAELAAVTVVSVYLAACGATTGGNTYEQQTRSTQSYATTTQSAAKTSTKATTKAATQSAAKATTKAAAKSATKSSVKATTKSSSSKKSKYNSYDDGYNAMYDDDDYDWERYKKDKEYADGVDDAMDELDW